MQNFLNCDIIVLDEKYDKKRIKLGKLKRQGLDSKYIKIFINLLEYILNTLKKFSTKEELCMINLKELTDEFSKYQIPNDDEVISWFINGDKNATLENWRFYQRCILGMLHLDEHFGGILFSKYDVFKRLEFLLGKSKAYEIGEESDEIDDIINLINLFLSSDNISNNSLLESNELLSYAAMYANTCRSFDDIGCNFIDLGTTIRENEKLSSNFFNLVRTIRETEELVESLSGVYNHIQDNIKVSLHYLKENFGLKVNIFMSKNQILKKINEKKDELTKSLEQLKTEKEVEGLKVKRKMISSFIEYFDSIENKGTLFERLKEDLMSLSEEQIRDIDVDNLLKFGGTLDQFRDECVRLGKKRFIMLKKDIIACAKLFRGFWVKTWSDGKDFTQLCQIIRGELSRFGAPSDAKIVEGFREELVDSNDGFIQGASLNGEQIREGMSILSQRFDEIMKIEDSKEYVSECAKFLHDFIMIHPYSDGNGRTSRLLLQTMLAKRNIIIPSLFDSTYHRPNYRYEKMSIMNGITDFNYLDNFSTAENLSSYTNDYTYVVDYVIHRVQQFNPNLINMVTEESIKSVSEGVDKARAEDMVCSIIAEIENTGKGVALDESRSGRSI